MDHIKVSQFIKDVCPARKQSFLQLNFFSECYLNNALKAKCETKIMCGSKAEFYIDPINTCIDDTDFLESNDSRLAFDYDYEPQLPPVFAGNSDSIVCFRMKPYSRYPGFFRLKEIGKLLFNWQSMKYEFSRTAAGKYVANNIEDKINREEERRFNEIIKSELSKKREYKLTRSETLYIRDAARIDDDFLTNEDSRREIQEQIKEKQNKTYEYHKTKGAGPALKHNDSLMGTYDKVHSTRCPWWPNQAKRWPRRERHHGWPQPETIKEVIESGCHLVTAKHRDCRNDPFQQRLSFSVAEVILLNTWNSNQQVVYHALRYFAKRVLIRHGQTKEKEVLCTYHLKTLMFWSCEQRSDDWWTDLCVIDICCDLLKELSQHLNHRHMPNYFVPEANLFGHKMDETVVGETLALIDQFCYPETLGDWFFDNYIKCSRSILRGIELTAFPINPDKNKGKKRTAREIVSRYEHEIFEYYFTDAFFNMLTEAAAFCKLNDEAATSSSSQDDAFQINQSRDEGIHFDEELFTRTTDDSWFQHFAPVLMLLFAEYLHACRGMSYDKDVLIDVTTVWLTKFKIHRYPENYKEFLDRSEIYFLKAEESMYNLTRSCFPSTPQFRLLIRMSLILLDKTLSYKYGKAIYYRDACLVYMAALFYYSGEHGRVCNLCLELMRDKGNDAYHNVDGLSGKRKLNSECLRFIDPICNILGFIDLFKHICTSSNATSFVEPDRQINPTVFAYYLLTVCNQSSINTDTMVIAGDRSVLDRCLLTSAKRTNVTAVSLPAVDETLSGTVTNENIQLVLKTADISCLLIECSLELLKSFYNSVLKDFGIDCKLVSCYEALYMYKCRRYSDVVSICNSILQEAEPDHNLERFAFANILALPPLDSFFDRDIQSLLGFQILFWYLLPQPDEHESLVRYTLYEFSRTGDFQVAVVVPLMHPAKRFQALDIVGFKIHEIFRRRHFIGRHFLAKYLKLQCLIACNGADSKIFGVLGDLKSRLSFENILVNFMHGKVKKFVKEQRRQLVFGKKSI